MISEEEEVKTEDKIKQAVMRGARILIGGVSDGSALFYSTVLECMSSEIGVCCSEIFSPMIVVRSYSDSNDVVKMVDESRYGLQGSIFTNSLDIMTTVTTGFGSVTVIVNETIRLVPRGFDAVRRGKTVRYRS